jgi:hypothetical protein
MLRDVFYYGRKPNVHPREQFAENLADARLKATTRDFWIINEFCDYRNFDWDFDFEFLPDEDVWAEDHNNVWPSQHQKDSGTWLCPKEYSDLIIYRGDVDPVIRKTEKTANWVELDLIDSTKFDFSWHPDPTARPYIYKWPCKFFPAEFKHVLEYRVPGATQTKYMKTIAELLPESDRWVEYQAIDKDRFDMSWRPNPLDPPFIYVWGNKYVDGTLGPTLEYHVPGATDIKHMPELVPVLPEKELFEHLEDCDGIDYSWKPDPTSPSYIYAWGNQWNAPEDKISIQYVVPGATEYKYMSDRAIRKSCMDNWIVPDDVDTTGFDFSWEPSPAAPPYIYEFGTQWQKTGGPQYVVPGATDKQHVDFQKVRILPALDKWDIPNNVDVSSFDFSWHPDDTDPDYTYQFGTQWALSGGPKYVVNNATEVKYIDYPVATALPDKTNWVYDDNIDTASFDFSWHPYVEDQSYIYEFGTQWQKTGGPKYITPGADSNSSIKYIDTRIMKATRLPSKGDSHWVTHYPIKEFDYSWHPDNTEEPYIYIFGNNQYLAEECATVEYRMEGAIQIKYIHDIVATLDVDMSRWVVPENVDTTGFDFSWIPNPSEPAYIYEFGTQWQKTGGPKYVMSSDEHGIKYVDVQASKRLPDHQNWTIPSYIDKTSFDFSWHPDDTEEPYIYVFATQWAFSGGPVYTVPGATEIKYVEDHLATALPDRTNWIVPDDVDVESFDFSWHPYVEDQPYIYEFGTQWQKTGGPKYITPEADSNSPIKYIDTRILKAIRFPNQNDNSWVTHYPIKEFDYSWHPDSTEEPFIYVFGNTLYPAEECATIEYRMEGATQIKYVSDTLARLADDRTNWVITQPIDEEAFDFSWVPNPNDPPYVYRWGNKYINNKYKATIEYVVPGATEIKYMTDDVEVLPEMERWEIPAGIDTEGFDFTWRPDPLEPDLIWEFGTQWQKTGGPRYIVDGATETKYNDTQKVTILPNNVGWIIPEHVDISEFDFSWHPDATDSPYIYQFGTQWALSGGPAYYVPDATEIKYMDEQTAIALPSQDNWVYDPTLIDATTFDFSWHPYAEDQPYIYEFGTQWQKTGGPKYITPGADSNSPIKYIDTRILKAKRLPNKEKYNWVNNYKIKDFDYSWHPDDTAEPYIYQFGTQWQKTGGPKYIVPGASEVSYVNNPFATHLPDKTNWVIPENIDATTFDYSWHPDESSPPYIYEFGTQWQKTGGPQYIVPGATEKQYVDVQKAKRIASMENWKIPEHIAITEFDFSWHPDDTSPPFIYVFGNQWYPAEEMATVTYVVPGGIEDKFVSDIVATLGKNSNNWEIPEGVDVRRFDFSWIPHPAAPPYIYQFGTLRDPTDGPIYITPNNNGETVRVPRIETDEVEEVPTETEININRYYITTTLEDLANQHPDELFWALNPDIDYSNFDFSWRPGIEQAEYIHVFGKSESLKTQTYFVNAGLWHKGLREFNFVDPQDSEAGESLDVFFVDRGNPESAARFEALKAKYGTKIQKTRYLNSWVDTINRCANRATSSLVWVLNSELDYDDFNFDYYPNPWQMKMVHVFGTQWSHWGTTFLVNRETFREDTKYIKIIEHLNNLNFVKEIRAKATKCSHDIVVIDHGNKETTDVVSTLKSKAPDRTVTTIKYNNSYLDTLREVIKRQPEKKDNFIWVCSSVCDYTGFDFTYIIDPFSRDNLHVFPSGKQKFGDTFFIDVTNAREVINELDKLENFTKVNYNGTVKAERLREPIIVVNDDTLTNSVDKITDFPYATLITSDNVDIGKVDIEPMNLWSAETKNIYVTSTGATRIIAPKEIKYHVTKELYEYPYIKRAPKLSLSNPLDIVFLSNGETGAEENYEHLLNITKNLPNRVVRVDGVNGRAAAYHAAAEASETSWMFTVFAKLKVSPKFDFNWQPDRMQVPKHYIFHAKNPVNGLVYGHQAMIAYNKKLTLANDGKGLDFTLDNEHEVVPLISGTAQYNTDEFSTWRTAFRETIKLRSDDSEVSRERLDAWLNKAEGDFAQYSIKGALDADEYYDEVDGDFDKLKLSYEWAWLKEKFDQS